MNSDTLKQSVVKSYGRLAKSKKAGFFPNLFACCDPTKNAKEVGKKIGYTEDEMNKVPEDSNLGVGCGNPSAINRLSKGDTVVDLGSGAGFDAFIISDKIGEKGRVIGLDLSDEMLKLSRKNASKGNYLNTEFVKADIEDIPLEDNLADHIISNCVINLSNNKGEVFKEAYRVLKPGGKLGISDIILEKELPNVIKNSELGHIACVSGAEQLEVYLQYIKDAGFKNIRIESKTSFPLELMLTDPQLNRLAKEMDFNLNSEQAKDIASRVKSISLSAEK